MNCSGGWTACLLSAALMALAPIVSADTVTGRIDYISKKAKTIQLTPKGAPPALISFDGQTQFVNAASIKDLGPKDLVEVVYTPGESATRITKKLFAIPKELEVDAQYIVDLLSRGDCGTPGTLEVTAAQVQSAMDRPGGCTLVDARPTSRYLAGHLPSAISIYAKDLPGKLDLLPEDKSSLVIFYCGGPTCPFTGESIKVAQAHGHTNVKGFQGGMPAWKKAGKPIHATPSWVAENLDEHHVIIDVRPRAVSSQSHIESAVAIPAEEFTAMTQTFIKERKKARLPGVSDTRAPIILYGDPQYRDDLLTAYGELKKWRYKNVAIVEGGFTNWVKQGLPVTEGPAETTITYTRKLKEGAIPAEDFTRLEGTRENVVLLDVRSPSETAKGTLKGPGARAIPLDEIETRLDQIPKQGKVVTYCSNGIRSEMAYQLLLKNGYSDVAFLNETVVIGPDGRYTIE